MRFGKHSSTCIEVIVARVVRHLRSDAVIPAPFRANYIATSEWTHGSITTLLDRANVIVSNIEVDPCAEPMLYARATKGIECTQL